MHKPTKAMITTIGIIGEYKPVNQSVFNTYAYLLGRSMTGLV